MAHAAQCAEQGESLWTSRFPSCRGETRSSELQLVIEVKAVHCPVQLLLHAQLERPGCLSPSCRHRPQFFCHPQSHFQVTRSWNFYVIDFKRKMITFE